MVERTGDHRRDRDRVILSDADVRRDPARIGDQRGERVLRRVDDLAEARRVGDLDELVAGRDHGDARRAHDMDLVDAERGEQAEIARAEAHPGGHGDLTGGDVVAGQPHVLARRRGR